MTASPTSLAPPDVADPPRPAAWSVVALLRRLHFYAGILVAPFLVVAALSGLLYAFTPQIDDVVHGDVLYAEPATGSHRPLAEQVAAAQAALPAGAMTGVLPADGPDATTKVVFALPELDADYRETVYVNPYTGKVQGRLTTWFGSTPVTTWLDGLHRHLQLGEPGRLYSELAASWLWVIALGGLALWFARWRTGRRRLRAFAVPDRAARGVRRTRSWHATIGVWTLLGALFLSATGLTWSTYAGENFGSALDALRATAAPLDTTLPGGTPAAGGGGGHEGHGGGAAQPGTVDPAAFERVLAGARAAGLDGPLEIGVAETPGAAWTAAQIDNTWPVRRDQVAVDPASGAVTARADFADRPFLAKLTTLGIQAHMGRLFGLVNQLVLVLVAAGILTLTVLGYRMWWQRRPTRADRRGLVGAPPARGGWRQLPLWVLIPGPLVLAAVGWSIPLLGASLLGFVVLDVLIALVRRARAGRVTRA